MRNIATVRMRKIYKSNCGITLRSKQESTEFLTGRLQQLTLENKGNSREAKYIERILEAASA